MYVITENSPNCYSINLNKHPPPIHPTPQSMLSGRLDCTIEENLSLFFLVENLLALQSWSSSVETYRYAKFPYHGHHSYNTRSKNFMKLEWVRMGRKLSLINTLSCGIHCHMPSDPSNANLFLEGSYKPFYWCPPEKQEWWCFFFFVFCFCFLFLFVCFFFNQVYCT